MTNEEAIRIIKAECYVNNPLDIDRTIFINTALDTAVRSMEKELKENKWFPVTEQLPPEGIEVLVTYEYKSITNPERIVYCVEAGNYYQGDWGVESIKYLHPGAEPHVIAWKPMPDAYYGEVTE